MDQAISVGIGVKDNHVIDQVNIYEATKLAMLEAIHGVDPQPPTSLDVGCSIFSDTPS